MEEESFSLNISGENPKRWGEGLEGLETLDALDTLEVLDSLEILDYPACSAGTKKSAL